MYFYLEITCAKQDLHSGVFGGSVHEATVELAHIISALVEPNGKIKVPGVMDQVRRKILKINNFEG